MAQRRHHYERAFEAFLRARRIPYVAVDAAKKALLPEGTRIRVPGGVGAEPGSGEAGQDGRDTPHSGGALKSFDFVVYGEPGPTGEPGNLLLDIKGRRIPRPKRLPRSEPSLLTAIDGGAAGGAARSGGGGGVPRGRLETWVTQEDVDALTTWQALFGAEFDAAFVFVYWCDEQPPDALFQEIFEDRGRWYALRAVRLRDYVAHMKPRSLRWRTVHLPAAAFDRVSQPFSGRGMGSGQ